MVPLPFSVEGKFAEQLQMLGTQCSTYSLQTMGYPALSEGTDILINQERLGVVKACSGLGMLMTFFALSTAVALVINRPSDGGSPPLTSPGNPPPGGPGTGPGGGPKGGGGRPVLVPIIIVASAVPIALISNVARITFTSMLYDATRNETVRQWAHDGAGWFMMIFALGLMWLELKFLTLLIIQEDPKERMPIDVFDKPLAPKPAVNGSKPPRPKKNAPIPVGFAPTFAPQKKSR
jgi:exosortase/archaeosortase family protein